MKFWHTNTSLNVALCAVVCMHVVLFWSAESNRTINVNKVEALNKKKFGKYSEWPCEFNNIDVNKDQQDPSFACQHECKIIQELHFSTVAAISMYNMI